MWKLQIQNGGLTLPKHIYTLDAREIEAPVTETNVSKIQTVVVNGVLRCQICLQDVSIQTSRCWEYDGWQLTPEPLAKEHHLHWGQAPPPWRLGDSAGKEAAEDENTKVKFLWLRAGQFRSSKAPPRQPEVFVVSASQLHMPLCSNCFPHPSGYCHQENSPINTLCKSLLGVCFPRSRTYNYLVQVSERQYLW